MNKNYSAVLAQSSTSDAHTAWESEQSHVNRFYEFKTELLYEDKYAKALVLSLVSEK